MKELKDGLLRSRSGDRLEEWVASGSLDMQRSFSKAIGSTVGGGILASSRRVGSVGWFGSLSVRMSA